MLSVFFLLFVPSLSWQMPNFRNDPSHEKKGNDAEKGREGKRREEKRREGKAKTRADLVERSAHRITIAKRPKAPVWATVATRTCEDRTHFKKRFPSVCSEPVLPDEMIGFQNKMQYDGTARRNRRRIVRTEHRHAAGPHHLKRYIDPCLLRFGCVEADLSLLLHVVVALAVGELRARLHDALR